MRSDFQKCRYCGEYYDDSTDGVHTCKPEDVYDRLLSRIADLESEVRRLNGYSETE